MKKLMSCILSLALCFSLAIPAFAFTSDPAENQVITFEEYFATVHEEFAKYGIDYQVIERNDDFVFTQKVLNEKITEIQDTMSKTTVSYNRDYDPDAEATVNSSVSSVGNEISAARIMPVEQVFQHEVYLECPYAPTLAWAYICMEVVALVDLQGGNLMSIESYSSFQKGAYLNFVSWQQRSMSVNPNYMAGTFRATVNGLLTVEYTEPTTGLLVGYTSEHTFSHTFSV